MSDLDLTARSITSDEINERIAQARKLRALTIRRLVGAAFARLLRRPANGSGPNPAAAKPA